MRSAPRSHILAHTAATITITTSMATAIRSIEDYASAVEVLLADDPESPSVLRAKDRVTTPLPSGYRDVLLNVTVPGCPVVVELQLHFHQIHELSK